jgi:putative SbcD/Mre11-related phosphoesterase
MKIDKSIQILDLTLYLRKHKTLILADSHIGYEEALNKQGVLIPRTYFNDLLKRIEPILKKTKPETIIINGDVKHEFGKISEQEWRHTLRFIDFLNKYCKNLILIRGNHDKVLGPIAEKRKITIADEVILDDILIMHGNKKIKIPGKIKTIIIGHEHPAVVLKQGAREERYKCFLKGKYKRKTLIVMPSFKLLAEGINILSERKISPYLKQDLSNFEIWIVEDKVYYFGKLKNLSK